MTIRPLGGRYEVVLKGLIFQTCKIVAQSIDVCPDLKTAEAAAKRFIGMMPDKHYSYLPEGMSAVTVVPGNGSFRVIELTSRDTIEADPDNIVIQERRLGDEDRPLQEVILTDEEASVQKAKNFARSRGALYLSPRSK